MPPARRSSSSWPELRALALAATAILMACTAPPPPPAVAEPKPDPTTEPWYAQTTQELAALAREAETLWQAGKTEQAAAIVTRGQPLLTRLISVNQPTLPAMEAISDLDDLYARMLLKNRHYSWARTLFQKNVYRWKNWKPESDDTARRLEIARAGVAECDRRMSE